MVRQYVQVTDEQRKELVRLIHEHNFSIARASKATEIPYDNAKAINRTYLKEARINKINYQQRYLNSKARKERLQRQQGELLPGQTVGDSALSSASRPGKAETHVIAIKST